jgi:methylsterol monooxygenase
LVDRSIVNPTRADGNQSSLCSSYTANWYIYIGNPVIATGLMSFLLHEVSPTPTAFSTSLPIPVTHPSEPTLLTILSSRRPPARQIVYFGRCIPWIIIDKMPMFRKYKLQPTKVPSNAQMWKCTKAVLLSHFTIELPQVSRGSGVCAFGQDSVRR